MYPPQNPPPELSASPVPATMGRWNAWPATCSPQWAFVFYAVCGAIVGVGIGALIVPMDTAYQWIFPISTFVTPGRRVGAPPLPPLPSPAEVAVQFMIVGLFGGLASGALLWLVVGIWNAAKHPIRSASLCASLGGSVALVKVAMQMLESFPDGEILMSITIVAMAMLLCAAFGYVHALIVRRAIVWLEWWQHRNDVVSG